MGRSCAIDLAVCLAQFSIFRQVFIFNKKQSCLYFMKQDVTS